jgi:hypothetical protein
MLGGLLLDPGRWKRKTKKTQGKETRRIVTKRETQTVTVGCCWLENDAVEVPTPIYKLLMDGASLDSERCYIRPGY